LVNDKFVESWDDPRMPTISGLRRRGTPQAVRNFCEKIGVQKREKRLDVSLWNFVSVRISTKRHGAEWLFLIQSNW
jgi:glutaminyl-tRNA synthetase